MDLKTIHFLSSLNCDKKVDLESYDFNTQPLGLQWNFCLNKVFILFAVTCIFFYTKIIHLSYKSKLRLLNQAPKTEDTSPCLLQKNYPSQKKYVIYIDLQFLQSQNFSSKWELSARCHPPSISPFLVEGGSRAGSSHFNEKFSLWYDT